MQIYKITNLINNKIYVGLTRRSIKIRWLEHHSGTSPCVLLRNAINKYGRENFKIETLEVVSDKDILAKKEIEYIQQLNSMAPFGYNLTSGGQNPKMTTETKLKIGIGNKGLKRSAETKAKISKAKKGIKRTPETIAKISASKRGKATNLNDPRSMKIICNETQTIFTSIRQAAKIMGLNDTLIALVLKGKHKQTKGFTFKRVYE